MTILRDRTIDVAVVGAGPSGFAAAITAARLLGEGSRVVLLEARERCAQTIKPTGDGRCNIANANTAASVYRNASFVRQVFVECSPAEALGFLESCGLVLRREAEGRLYPLANKSTSVIDAMRLAAVRAGVAEACDSGVRHVRRTGDGKLWACELADGMQVPARRVVICAGGGFDADLLPEGIPVSPWAPVLGPVATSRAPIKGLDKLRAKCALSLQGARDAGDWREVGEVTFRTWGISGIVAFDLSRVALPGDVVKIDFLPDLSRDASRGLLAHRLDSLRPATWLDLTCGMLLPLVARAVLRAAGLNAQAAPSPAGLPALDAALRGFPLTVEGIGDAKLCQVHRGGIDVSACDAPMMALRGAHGLHAAGEALDVDGPCGGYNLHWAWASGIVAGRAAARGLQPGDATA